MRAIVCDRYGAPDVLRVDEVPTPAPRAHEVLIEVRATTVTSGDTSVRGLDVPRGFGPLVRLAMGFSGPRQRVLGTELAGVVVATGPAVTRFAVGDEVFAMSDSMGCHAEYRVMAETAAISLKPSELSFEQAAALSFGGTTALEFFRRAALQPGERVLIFGASGGVGSAAVQLAKHFGAHVTGVCSTANVELVRSLGADEVVDYTETDCTKTGEHYDMIMDTIGALPLSRCGAALRRGGRLLAIRASLLELVTAPFASLFSGKRVIAGPAIARAEDVRLLATLAQRGAYRPFIDRTYPFERAAEAHAYVDSKRKRGNVVLTVPHGGSAAPYDAATTIAPS